MKTDILGLIREQKEITNVLILTHNIDFVFVQNLLIHALRPCGAPSLTIFADAQCAADTFAVQAPLLSNLGRRYRVLPVTSPPGFRFHPKACLLSGRTGAQLLIGSGNLTFGGWRENAELWTSFDSRNGTAEFNAFREYIEELVRALPLNAGPLREVRESFEPRSREWAGSMDSPRGLVGRLSSGPRLLEQMVEELGGPGGDRFIVCSPYFDEDGEALSKVVSAVGARETLVLTDSVRTNLRPSALSATPSGAFVRGASAHRMENEQKRRAFLHAKFYAVERGADVTLLLGSANCSRAALTIPGSAGNAELMALRHLTLEEFHSEILADLEISEGPPTLPEAESATALLDAPAIPQILAARAERGLLRIAFRAPDNWSVTQAVFDDDLQPIRLNGIGSCECVAPEAASQVRLRGQVGERVLDTLPMWIDHEEALVSTSYSRSLEQAIRAKGQGGEWELDDWADVLRAFCQDLQYVPQRAAQERGHNPTNDEPNTFNRSDIFATDLSPALQGHHTGTGDSSQASSLRSLILRWFSQGDEDLPDTPAVSHHQGNGGLPGELDEVVDQPETLQSLLEDAKRLEQRQRRTKRDKQNALRIIAQMVSFISSPDSLRNRHPVDLARDLKLASVLLRMGVHKQWVERDEFLAATFKIWSALFLGANDERPAAIQSGLEEEPHSQLASPVVAAALFAWGMEIPDTPATPRESQLLLALALCVSRHPRIWISGDLEAMADELVLILRATGEAPDLAVVQARWRDLTMLGSALGRFELALTEWNFRQLRESNHAKSVERGELTYQGPLGYTIAQESALRTTSQNVRLLLLRSAASDESLVRADFVNPVSGLMHNSELRERLMGNEAAALAIEALLARLRGAWAS